MASINTTRYLKYLLICLPACNHPGGWLATVGPDYQTAPLPISAEWHTQQVLAHKGEQADLIHWWEGFQDPVLTQLIQAAQRENATIGGAMGKIEQARANMVGADTSTLPTLDGTLASKRSSASFGGTPFLWDQQQIGLQSSWEIDLFGGLARQGEAAHSQLESRRAAWHDARVAVAVEVANAYLGYRYCEVQVDLLKADAESRLESLRLRKIAKLNGFQPNTEVAQFGANAADGNRSLLQQQTQCERSIKGLVALTAIDEPQLRQLLVSVPDKVGKLPNPPAFQIDAVPAKALLQRPDLVAAERDVAEANANIGVEQAKRYPKLSLSGNITPTLQNINSTGYMLAQTWAIGPTISLPMFDGGKRAANVDSAKAQYEAAVSNFKSKVRTAVKEVEEALVRLDSAGKRLPEAQNAESAYHLRLQAAHTLYQAGFNSLIDVEAAKRSDLNASLAAKDIEQEQVSAWIALYRAVGGSWDSEAERQLNGTAVAQPENPKEPVQPQEIDQSSKGKS